MELKFFGYLRSCVLWRKRLRRFGPQGIESALTNRIRYAFTFFAVLSRQNQEGYMALEPKRTVLDWGEGIMWYVMEQVMKTKTAHFNHLITFMQVRMRGKVLTKDAKVDVLKTMWDLKLFHWLTKATKTKDEGMKHLITLIQKVNPEVMEWLLSHYIKQCRKKHAIAFIEWRLHYSLNRLNSTAACQLENKDIQAIITDRVEYVRRDF